MRKLQDWLAEYGESHQNETNKLIHWICVPAIFLSIVGLMYTVKLPFIVYGYQLNIAVILMILVIFYYGSLSGTIWIGMFFFGMFCLYICYLIEGSGLKLWLVSIIIFALAWVGQFYGHKIEGKKPSFLRDIQFLMIGPAWLMSFIYKKLGIPF